MSAARPSPVDRTRPGLRERKKLQTRDAIRRAAHALVEEQGYDATTVEQIADRAEVSPSTVFRYFPAKEDIVLGEDPGPALVARFRARPVDEPWPRALRHVLREAVGDALREGPEVTRMRCRLMAEIPAVRSRGTQHATAAGRLLAEALGERTGRAPESLEVRVLAMSLVGGLTEGCQYWARTGFRDDPADLVDRALAVYDRDLGGDRDRGPENP
ncbi:TetR/AcrR family transcriptional regulator [Streptomyces sp. NPDC089424]|uniref:TetR/AcrR family transcriptional regulator n=1 Tax=Streptomyces sp. NPDC089424 TaxID=3365917 RepID=UPI003818FE02